MNRIAALVLKDLWNVRLPGGLFLAVLAAQVWAVFVSTRGNVEASLIHSGLAFVGWVLQFLLVAQIIQSDAPSRPGAQWRTRPFGPASLIAAKFMAILGLVLAPPWISSQILRAVLGLGAGIGSWTEVLSHATGISVLVLLSLATPSVAKAFLTGITLLLPLALVPSAAAFLVGYGIYENPPTLPLPPEIVAALCILALAAIGLLSAYVKGSLALPMLVLVVPVLALFMIIPFRHDETWPEPVATLHEDVRIEVSTEPWPQAKDQVSIGQPIHTPTDRGSVMWLTGGSLSLDGGDCDCGGYVSPGPIGDRGGARVDVRGLGPVGLVGPRRSWEPPGPPRIGPVEVDELRKGGVSGRDAEVKLNYDLRSYALVDRVRAVAPLHRLGTHWRLSLIEARQPGSGMAMSFTTVGSPPRLGVFDPASLSVQLIDATNYSATAASVLWPIGSGIAQFQYFDPTGKTLAELLRGRDLVWLDEQVLGSGEARIKLTGLTLPPDGSS